MDFDLPTRRGIRLLFRKFPSLEVIIIPGIRNTRVFALAFRHRLSTNIATYRVSRPTSKRTRGWVGRHAIDSFRTTPPPCWVHTSLKLYLNITSVHSAYYGFCPERMNCRGRSRLYIQHDTLLLIGPLQPPRHDVATPDVRSIIFRDVLKRVYAL